MGIIRNVAIAVLAISFLTFVAFFGRLPALRLVYSHLKCPCIAKKCRNTPIGALHRVMWIHIPGGFRKIDQKLTDGRLSAWVGRLAHTLWNDRHPLVMVRLDTGAGAFSFFPLNFHRDMTIHVTKSAPVKDLEQQVMLNYLQIPC
jgi:palmitoyltransferase